MIRLRLSLEAMWAVVGRKQSSQSKVLASLDTNERAMHVDVWAQGATECNHAIHRVMQALLLGKAPRSASEIRNASNGRLHQPDTRQSLSQSRDKMLKYWARE
jgi:hypothetical protein